MIESQFEVERQELLDSEKAKRRKLEARLLKSLWRSEGHRRLAESNIIGVMFGDTDGGISSANDEFLRILGHSRDTLDVQSLRWDTLTPSEHRAKDAQAMEELAIEEWACHREGSFDGVLSNFGGLTCVEDLPGVARGLAAALRPGARARLCLMGPAVPWAWGWYLAHGEPR